MSHSPKSKTKSDAQGPVHRGEFRLALLSILETLAIFLVLAGSFVGPIIHDLYNAYPYSPLDRLLRITRSSPELLFQPLAIVMFYLIVRVALGGGPISARLASRTSLRSDFSADTTAPHQVNSDNGTTNAQTHRQQTLVNLEPISVLDAAYKRSLGVVQSIRNWATANLIAGVFIGFAGVAIFYSSQTASQYQLPDTTITVTEHPHGQGGAPPSTKAAETPTVKNDWTPITLAIAGTLPRIVILAFVEMIAVFFLRQYRISMIEYRALEGILRVREAEMFAATVRSQTTPAKHLVELSDKLFELERLPILEHGQTTEAIETLRAGGQSNEVTDALAQLSSLLRAAGDKVSSIISRSKKSES